MELIFSVFLIVSYLVGNFLFLKNPHPNPLPMREGVKKTLLII